jgi:regulator of sigma E protease
LSWFLAFAGFAVLVILHEAGHFAVAKAVGMRVERFSLFFPPTIASKKIGETEYAIGALPLGGYVKISGMNPDEKLPPEARDRAYHAQPVWKRIVVIAAGPSVNLVLAFLLMLVFYWGIGAHDFGVGPVQKGYPAAGELRSGDKILSVDGRKAVDPSVIQDQIGKHRCRQRPPTNGCKATTPVDLVIQRNGRRLALSIVPIYDAKQKRPRIGIGYKELASRVPVPLGKALNVTTDQFWFITKATVSLPARLFDTKKRKEISGVVGSYEVTRQTILRDPADVVFILAIISLSLAIINLFPFLPLDGGHIFWAIVEKVRRRPVPLSVMERASVVGFMLVIGLFLIGFTNDIGRLTGQGFSPR